MNVALERSYFNKARLAKAVLVKIPHSTGHAIQTYMYNNWDNDHYGDNNDSYNHQNNNESGSGRIGFSVIHFAVT